MSIKLKSYQQEAYDAVKNEFKKSNRAAIIHPTGTGKSYIALKLIQDNNGKRVLYLAPGTSILHQMKENSIKENGKTFSNMKRMTYQKLSSLSLEDKEKLNPDIIVLDEFHHCGSPVWGKNVQELLEIFPQTKVLGLSATPIRYFDGNIDMAEELFGEHIASEISFSDALEREILPEFDYVSAMYGYDNTLSKLREKIKKSNVVNSRKEEAKNLFSQLSKQLNSNTDGLPDILKKHMPNKNGKYMVFCSNIEEMQKKIEEAQGLFSKVNSDVQIYAVSSDEDIKNNQKILKKFENDDDKNTLKLMFSVNMLNEGYHLPDIDGIIMMRPTKSPTIFLQQLGRALTVKNSSKRAVIIDLVDNFDSIRVIEKTLNSLRNRKKGQKNQTNTEKKNFKLFDYTKNIGDISKKIEKLCKMRSLSLSEKIDLFEKFMVENPNDFIHSDTIFEGYPIGSYLIQIRQSMIYGKDNLKYNENDKNRLEKLGVLYKGRNTLGDKIKRLKVFCAKYPYAFFDMTHLKNKLSNNPKELEYFYKIYESDYKYLTHRKSNNKLPDEMLYDLQESKIGGSFGLAEEDKEISEKYDITNRYIFQIIEDFGSIDNLKKAYIQFQVDLSNAKSIEEKENILSKNKIILNYIDFLPLVTYFDLCNKPSYINFINDILDRNHFQSFVLDDELVSTVDSMLDTLDDREKEILKIRSNIGYDKTITYEDIAKQFDISRERVRQLEFRAIRKLKAPSKINFILSHLYEPSEEFIRLYFDMHDVFYTKDEQNLSDEDINKLLEICTEQKRIEKELQAIESSHHIKDVNLPITDLELSVRVYNCLYRCGIKTINDLIEIINTPKNFDQIRNLGKKSRDEIINKVHSFGFKFKYEEDNTKYRENSLENEVQKEKKDYNIIDENGHINISQLGLSARVYNCLYRCGIKTIDELLEKVKSAKDLYNIRNLGKKSKDEIVDKVHNLGFKFSYEEDIQKIENPDEEQKKAQLKDFLRKRGIIPIDEIGFSQWTYNCLSRDGIFTLNELLEGINSYDDFSKMRSCGEKTINEIMDMVHSLGFKFKYEENITQESDIQHESTEKKETSIISNEENIKQNDKPSEIIDTTISYDNTNNIKNEKENDAEKTSKNKIQSNSSEENTDFYAQLASNILVCENKHLQISKKVQNLEIQKNNITQEIIQLSNQLDEYINSSKITPKISIALQRAYTVLQAQKEVLSNIDDAIIETKKAEKANREKRDILIKKCLEIIRGGN